MRILLPEGSSLSARQAVNALASSDYEIDVCDPDEWCICRFSRNVHKVYRTPAINEDPITYLNAVMTVLTERHYDVLLPIHENAYLFANEYDQLSKLTRIPIASFEAFERVQSKVEFMRLLEELDLPHPKTKYALAVDDVLNCANFPVYVKAPFGTAGSGTWLVKDPAGLKDVALRLERDHSVEGRVQAIIQDVAPGTLCVAQAVFNHGSLLAVHMYEQSKYGVGGSASARIAIDHPVVREHMQKIGAHLQWHGSLMIDYLFDSTSNQVAYIEANPRPGETMNATESGVNLIQMLVRIAMEDVPSPVLGERIGIRSHSGIAVLLGIAQRSGSRWAIFKESVKMMFKQGEYRHSKEDLTPVMKDWPSVVPMLVIFFTLMMRPSSVEVLSAKTIGRYSLGVRAVSIIRSREHRRDYTA